MGQKKSLDMKFIHESSGRKRQKFSPGENFWLCGTYSIEYVCTDFSFDLLLLSLTLLRRFGTVMSRLCDCLKPGGMLLFRDYGRYDMAQLRFKKGQTSQK